MLLYLIMGSECSYAWWWHLAVFVWVLLCIGDVIAYTWHVFEYLYWNRYKLSPNIWSFIIPINRGSNNQINKYLIGLKSGNYYKTCCHRFQQIPKKGVFDCSEILTLFFLIFFKSFVDWRTISNQKWFDSWSHNVHTSPKRRKIRKKNTANILPARFGKCGWNIPALARNSSDRCGGTKPGFMCNCNINLNKNQLKTIKSLA